MPAVTSTDLRIFLPPCINFPRRQKHVVMYFLYIFYGAGSDARPPRYAETRGENIDVETAQRHSATCRRAGLAKHRR